jgi:ABC-2 type transport system ATP-binding protein
MNRAEHTTIVLTTHDLGDIERLCSRVILIDHGKVLYDGSVEQLKARYAPHRVLVVQLAPGSPLVPDTAIEAPGVELIRHEPMTLRLRFDPLRVGVAELIARVTARYAVSDLSIVEPELGDVIRQLYDQRAVRAS